jgi:hypothetical protein
VGVWEWFGLLGSDTARVVQILIYAAKIYGLQGKERASE